MRWHAWHRLRSGWAGCRCRTAAPHAALACAVATLPRTACTRGAVGRGREWVSDMGGWCRCQLGLGAVFPSVRTQCMHKPPSRSRADDRHRANDEADGEVLHILSGRQLRRGLEREGRVEGHGGAPKVPAFRWRVGALGGRHIGCGSNRTQRQVQQAPAESGSAWAGLRAQVRDGRPAAGASSSKQGGSKLFALAVCSKQISPLPAPVKLHIELPVLRQRLVRPVPDPPSAPPEGGLRRRRHGQGHELACGSHLRGLMTSECPTSRLEAAPRLYRRGARARGLAQRSFGGRARPNLCSRTHNCTLALA